MANFDRDRMRKEKDRISRELSFIDLELASLRKKLSETQQKIDNRLRDRESFVRAIELLCHEMIEQS